MSTSPLKIVFMRHGAHRYGELTDEGKQQIEDSGNLLLSHGHKPDIILHSPLPRAVQSAKILKTIFGSAAIQEVESLSDIYNADDLEGFKKPCLEALRAFPEGQPNIFVVSHEPTIECFTYALGEQSVCLGVGKTAIYQISSSRWADVEQGSGVLVPPPPSVKP